MYPIYLAALHRIPLRRQIKSYQILLTAPAGQCRICLIAFDRGENISNLTFTFSQCWSVWPDSAKCPPAEIQPTIYRSKHKYLCLMHVIKIWLAQPSKTQLWNKCLPESWVVSCFLTAEGNLCLLGGNHKFLLTWR